MLQRELGIEGDPAELAAERIAIVSELFATEADFVDGFLDFFERVRDRYRMCIATAMSEDLLAIVNERLGLTRLFEGRVFSVADVEGRSKPDPALFLYAADKLGSAPGACVVIEDSPLGIEAAMRAGMRVVGITTTYRRERLSAARLVVDDFAEIDLAALESQPVQPRG